VLGAALLVVAEFSPLYEVVVGALEIVRRSVDNRARDHHAASRASLKGVSINTRTHSAGPDPTHTSYERP